MAFPTTGIADNGNVYRVRVSVYEPHPMCRGVMAAKFENGSGIALPRDSPAYYETIGRWFCGEVGAGRVLPDGSVESP